MNGHRHTISHELKEHVPFTVFGTLTGIVIMLIFTRLHLPHSVSAKLFWTLHPLHVLLSAIATAGMYRLYCKGSLVATVAIGYVGSIGIGTLSDSLIPYLGEVLLDLPHRHAHVGFIEMWWLVNPLALLGVGIAWFWPHTKIPHAGHVLLSTWASLFHMTMAVGETLGVVTVLLIALFLFLAVWQPCCTSDIVFPLLFTGKVEPCGGHMADDKSGEAVEP
ncbi:MAG: hypothetical protein JSV03_14335 [Planctomycetota bacterium]|nr:MAG: hypothetical protein JSV03_14335 [Planctomycetota bacterium]